MSFFFDNIYDSYSSSSLLKKKSNEKDSFLTSNNSSEILSIFDNKTESLYFDNISFLVDLPDNHSSKYVYSNIDISNVNLMNENLNTSFASNIDNEYIDLFKENKNNNTQRFEIHENEEEDEIIEENSNKNENENVTELLLNESQVDLSIINNNESYQFSKICDYGTQTCNRIMKGTEHCTEYSYPHYIEIIENNSEYYYDRIQFSFKLNFPNIQNSNCKNYFNNESLILDLSKEKINNISFLSSFIEEEELIKEKEIEKQKLINYKNEKVDNLEKKTEDNSKYKLFIKYSYKKELNNKRIVNISNKKVNDTTIQIVKSKNKIIMNELDQKDKIILQKMVNILEGSYEHRSFNQMINIIKRKNNFEKKQKKNELNSNIKYENNLLLKKGITKLLHKKDDMQDDYVKLFKLSIMKKKYLLDIVKKFVKYKLLKLLNYKYYYDYKKNNNFFYKTKIIKKLFFSILKHKKQKSNKINVLNCNSKIFYNLSDNYMDFNRNLLKKIFTLFFYKDKYIKTLSKKSNKLKNFVLHNEKAKFIPFIYLLKIVKKIERLKYF